MAANLRFASKWKDQDCYYPYVNLLQQLAGAANANVTQAPGALGAHIVLPAAAIVSQTTATGVGLRNRAFKDLQQMLVSVHMIPL